MTNISLNRPRLFALSLLRYKRAHLLLALLAVGGCDNSDDPGTCPAPHSVAIVDLDSAANLMVSASNNSSTQYEFITSDTAVSSEDYLLSVTTSVIRTKYGSQPRLSCLTGLTSTQRVVDIDIVSDQAISDDLPAGSSLRTAFNLVSENTNNIWDSNFGHTTFVYNQASPPSLTDYLARRPPAPLTFALRLATSVAAEASHTFTITYTLDNDNVFTEMAEAVRLRP